MSYCSACWRPSHDALVSRVMLVRFLLLLLVTVVSTSCTKSIQSEGGRAEEALASLERRVENEDNQSIIEDAQTFLLQYPGNKSVDRVMYVLGKAYLETGEFAEAEHHFSRVSREFPESGYADDAFFMLGETYLKQSLPAAYDQDMTERALTQFLAFVELYPASELLADVRREIELCQDRLAKKRYMNGALYAKLGYHKIAARYFEDVVRDYPGTEWASESLLAFGMSLEKLKRYDDARAAYQALVNDAGVPRRLRDKALKRLSRLDKAG